MEIIIGILAILLSVGTFLIGRADGKKQSYNKKIEDEKKRIIDTYTDWNHKHYDNGIHALTKLGLPLLENDKNIRNLIEKIRIIDGKSPFGPYESILSDIDLYQFFKYISDYNVNIHKTKIETIIASIKKP